jgi:hypothetical protein
MKEQRTPQRTSTLALAIWIIGRVADRTKRHERTRLLKRSLAPTPAFDPIFLQVSKWEQW